MSVGRILTASHEASIRVKRQAPFAITVTFLDTVVFFPALEAFGLGNGFIPSLESLPIDLRVGPANMVVSHTCSPYSLEMGEHLPGNPARPGKKHFQKRRPVRPRETEAIDITLMVRSWIWILHSFLPAPGFAIILFVSSKSGGRPLTF